MSLVSEEPEWAAKGRITPLRYKVMGPLEILTPEGWTAMPAPKWCAVLALLLINRNQVVSMEQIIDELWGEFPPAGPTKTVQVYVSRIRQSMSADMRDRLVSRASGYQLVVEQGEIDAQVFDGRLMRARTELARHRPERAVEELREALALSCGPAFAGIPGVARIPAERLRLEESYRTALRTYVDARFLMGESHDLIAELRTFTAEYPLDEGLSARLMLALARSGRQADALDTFTRTRDMLVDQLGVDPGNELRQAQSEVLNGTGSGTNTLRHLLTGTDGTDPAVVAVTPRQLPPSVAGFAGRTRCLRQLDSLVSDPRAKLLGALNIAVITGEHGVGKTTLATYWAHQACEHFPDGQLYADLTGAAGQHAAAPAVILEQFIRALCPVPPSIQASQEERAALCRSLLAGKHVLILLDNAQSAAQVWPLLPGSADCLVLVTSRYELADLASAYGALRLPLDKLGDDEATQLLRLPSMAAKWARTCS